MSSLTPHDLATLTRIDGELVTSLTPDERATLTRAEATGRADQVRQGMGATLGLATVRVLAVLHG